MIKVSAPSQILIVDDEPGICWAFREFLTDDGYEVRVCSSAEEALQVLPEWTPDAIVMDVRLPGMDGLTAMKAIRDIKGGIPIIVITAFGDLETAVKAVEEGAVDYLPKPFDLDQVGEVIARALAQQPQETESPADSLPLPVRGGQLVGSSPQMQQVFKKIALVAPADVPVLITGESGTGKELVARAIHQHGPRRDKPFLPVCLAALSPGIVESELFGHVKGAFTGATENRIGLLEQASGGTVFLDEIADTSPALQVKLLRAIEQQEVTPVGDSRPRPINARIITATNRPIPELIQRGEFREDFYFRLSVFHIQLPPLRDRREDIPQLAEYFLKQTRNGAPSWPLSQNVLQVLEKRNWTGNVRELKNVIEHAAIVARGKAIRPEDLPAPLKMGALPAAPGQPLKDRVSDWLTVQLHSIADAAESSPQLYEQFLSLVEPLLLKALLTHCGDNKAAAAQLLGIHRATLRQKLRKYNLDPNEREE